MTKAKTTYPCGYLLITLRVTTLAPCSLLMQAFSLTLFSHLPASGSQEKIKKLGHT